MVYFWSTDEDARGYSFPVISSQAGPHLRDRDPAGEGTWELAGIEHGPDPHRLILMSLSLKPSRMTLHTYSCSYTTNID